MKHKAKPKASAAKSNKVENLSKELKAHEKLDKKRMGKLKSKSKMC